MSIQQLLGKYGVTTEQGSLMPGSLVPGVREQRRSAPVSPGHEEPGPVSVGEAVAATPSLTEVVR